jgi:hypothetical protein
MAIQRWLGQAVAIKQKITVTVGGTLAGETFKIGVGGTYFAEHTDTTTTIADTVAALVAAWSASTHPWAAAITATDASPDIVLEANIAGVPFGTYKSDSNPNTPEIRGYWEVDLNTPGGSATLTQAETTPNEGPNCANLATNWSNGTYLADGDDVSIADSGIDIKWGLDYRSDTTNAVTADSFDCRKSFTGKMGLDYATFDGNAAAPEYRDCYFGILVDGDQGKVKIGEHNGPGSPAGSRRIMLDLRNNAAPTDIGAEVEIYGCYSQPQETGRPAIRLLTDNGATKSTSIFVRGCVGGFGLAMDKPGETSVAARISINCQSTKDQIFTGPGIKLTNAGNGFEQNGGYCILQHSPSDGGAAILGDIQLDAGELWTEGDFEVDNFHNDGGTAYLNHYNSESGQSYVAIDDAFLNSGVTDTTKSNRSRTWSNVSEMREIHDLRLHGTSVTITNYMRTRQGGVAGG